MRTLTIFRRLQLPLGDARYDVASCNFLRRVMCSGVRRDTFELQSEEEEEDDKVVRTSMELHDVASGHFFGGKCYWGRTIEN